MAVDVLYVHLGHDLARVLGWIEVDAFHHPVSSVPPAPAAAPPSGAHLH
jgi:hypothetical protein